MTANQVAYWKNVETERANRAEEAIKQQEATTHEMKAKADVYQREKEFQYQKKRDIARSLSAGFQSFSNWGTGMFQHAFPSGDTVARVGGSILSDYLGGKFK